MSLDYLNNIRVQIGVFNGDAPAATVALWQSIVPAQIQVHSDVSSGMKTYLVNDFPPGMDSFQYAQSLIEAGIPGAKSVHLMDGIKLRKGWDGFKIIGPQTGVIDPIGP